MRYLSATLLLAALCVTKADAQTPSPTNPQGFFLGAHLLGGSIKSNEPDSDAETMNGGGAGMQLGYGFNKNWAMFGDFTATAMNPEQGDSYGLGHFDLGMRYHFTSPSRSLVPFLDAAFTGRAAVQENVDMGGETGDLSLSGTGFSFGGGLQYFVNPVLALNSSLRFTVGQFDRAQFDNVSVDDLNIDATTTRLNLGIVWYPQARKTK